MLYNSLPKDDGKTLTKRIKDSGMTKSSDSLFKAVVEGERVLYTVQIVKPPEAIQ